MNNKTILFKLIFIVFLVVNFDKGYSQIYLDTIIYSGKFNMENKDFSFHRIRQIGENLTDRIISENDNFTAETEVLEIYNDKNIKILSCQTSEVLADCNSASIIKAKCVITDSTIEIIKYCFWTGLCVSCDVGIIYETYKLNNKDTFEIVRKLDKTFIDKKGKIKFTQKELQEFERIISKYRLLKQTEKTKMINMIKK